MLAKARTNHQCPCKCSLSHEISISALLVVRTEIPGRRKGARGHEATRRLCAVDAADGLSMAVGGPSMAVDASKRTVYVLSGLLPALLASAAGSYRSPVYGSRLSTACRRLVNALSTGLRAGR